MKQLFKLSIAVLLVVGLLATGVSPVAAQEDDDDDDEGGDTIININLDEVVEAVQNLIDDFEDFTSSWDETLKEVAIAVLFEPFRLLLQQLMEIVGLVLMNTPSVYPNQAVEEVHQQVLMVTYIVSGIGFMVVGLLYMFGPVLGVSYQQVRMILPRLIIALVFGSVSLPLLQYMVELSDVLVLAFKPDQLSMSLSQSWGITTALVLAWVINAVQLLVLVVIFIMRDVYILFVAAISPLLALAWAFPKSKRYADSFIAGWFTALAMAPLDMIVLRFCMALLDGGSGLQYVSNWILGVASFTLLILVPYQLYGASQTAVGQAYSIAGGVKTRYKKQRRQKRHRELLDSNSGDQNFSSRRDSRVRPQRTGAGNKYGFEIEQMHKDGFDTENRGGGR